MVRQKNSEMNGSRHSHLICS